MLARGCQGLGRGERHRRLVLLYALHEINCETLIMFMAVPYFT